MVVLALVSEEPMHPYRMQVLIRERGKDRIANVAQRNSVYQTIAALLRAGLIAVRETSRDERRPERTVYEVTPEGRRMLDSWMRAVLSTPARDFPDFPAALSLVAGVRPEEVRSLLETRIGALEERLGELEKPFPNLPRLFLLEDEYMAAVLRAEIAWLRSVISDLRSGRLAWSEQWLRQIAKKLASQGGDAAQPKQVGAASTARNAALASASRKPRDTKRAIRRSRPR
jgi:DNA-binding PadR family transcriptional regulator